MIVMVFISKTISVLLFMVLILKCLFIEIHLIVAFLFKFSFSVSKNILLYYSAAVVIQYQKTA